MITIIDSYDKTYPFIRECFPDATAHSRVPKIDGFPLWIDWHYENDSELFDLICLKRHLDQKGPNIGLILAYLPNARMDRVQEETDVFTLKYFCEVINSLNFMEVRVLDPHSNVGIALLDRVTAVSPARYIHRAIEESGAEVLFFPDEGAMKRYSKMAEMPYAFGLKKRDWATGKILGLDIVNAELLKGKKVLIVDDICSRGGTFYYAAKAIGEAGAANISLYITHAEHTMTSGDMYVENTISHIYTTNSIFDPSWDIRNKVTVFNI